MKHGAATFKKNKTIKIFSVQFQICPNVQYPEATRSSYFPQRLVLHLNYILFKCLGKIKWDKCPALLEKPAVKLNET